MWRSIASNALTFFIVVLFFLGGVVLWGREQYSAPGPLADAICLEVPAGSNMRSLSKNLEEQGAISYRSIFDLGVNYTGVASQLKAGSYLVPENASMAQILEIVTRGGQSTCGTQVLYIVSVNGGEVRVRELDPATRDYALVASFDLGAAEVPAEYAAVLSRADTRYSVNLAEGVTSWQVVESLKQIDTLAGDVAAVPAEGTLAPDAYEFTPGADRNALIARMSEAQTAILADAWSRRAEGLPYDTPEEALIMASIVEKETGIAGERALVASVFVNRLNQGMPLQTDPTVIYGITNGQGVLGRGLRQSELQRETPYNTYVIRGLPPTPIANPGRDAIEAAVNPDQSDYIFFVAKTLDPADGHAFAATLSEHNDNVAALRALERAANN